MGYQLARDECVVHQARPGRLSNPRPQGYRPSLPNGKFTAPRWWGRLIPDGWEAVTTRTGVLSLARDTAEEAMWRTDKYRAWMALWEAVTRRMDWSTGLITVTREVLAETTAALSGRSMSARSVTRYLADARRAGWLLEIESGASKSALRGRTNRAATWLVIAPVDESGRPTTSGDPKGSPERDSSSVNSATENQTEDGKALHAPAMTHRSRLAAAKALILRCAWSGVPAGRLARALRRWFDQGFTAFDVLRALDHRPEGGRHPGPVESKSRSVIAVVCHRLRLWTGGLPTVSRPAPAPVVVESVPASQATRRAAMDMIRSVTRRQHSPRLCG